jgi:hypothetical protein
VVARGGEMRRRHGRARAELDEGDDRWGPPVSRARRGVKAVRGEAFPREGGGNCVGCHRRVGGWAERPDGPTGRWAD